MHVLGMPPAFVLSQDQTLKLIAPKTADPERPTPQARSERPNSSQAYHPTPSQGPEPVSRIRKTNRYADRSTQRRPRIPSILSTFSTAKPIFTGGPLRERAANLGVCRRPVKRLFSFPVSAAPLGGAPSSGAAYLDVGPFPVQHSFRKSSHRGYAAVDHEVLARDVGRARRHEETDARRHVAGLGICLLYTSDAADE